MAQSVYIAKPLAPEDIRAGDYVAPLHVIYEIPSFLWCGDSASLPPHVPVQISLLPQRGGIPLKVKAICLPYVFVESPRRKPQVLDVRRCRLARLDQSYGKMVWRALRKKRSSGQAQRK